jgi:twitching motility protein PilI
MAQKEALRELQSRLAGRLASAQSGSAGAAWLAVRMGEQRFLLPLAQSGEIFPMRAPTRVPHAQTWFLGVVNLRGGLFGVADLARWHSPQAPLRAEQALAQAHLVTLHPDLDVNCALVVDALDGLRQAGVFTGAQDAPAGAPTYFGRVLTDSQGQAWQELNLLALVQTPQFLHIRAE